MKWPTRNNCPECSEQYWEFRQSQANRRSIHAQDEYHHHNMDRRLKNRSVHDWLGKRVIDQNWADYGEEDNKEKYILQEGQWCPGGLTRSQKRRVQRLRNRELEQAMIRSNSTIRDSRLSLMSPWVCSCEIVDCSHAVVLFHLNRLF